MSRYLTASFILHFLGGVYLWINPISLVTPTPSVIEKKLTIEIVQNTPPAPKPKVIKPKPVNPPPAPKVKPKEAPKKVKPTVKKPPSKVKKKPPVTKPARTTKPVKTPPPEITPIPSAEPTPVVSEPIAKPPVQKPFPQPSITNAEKQNYRSALRAAILENRRYPRQAIRRRMEGSVDVQFTLLKSGKIVSINIVKSSGHKLLDKAAKQAVEKVGTFQPIPEAYGKDFWKFTIPVVFKVR